jgi:hypothetical protein
VRLVWDLELTLHGLTWGDFAFRVGDETDALMRAALVDLWKEEGLSGLSGFEPVEITRARGSEKPPPPYVHVAVEVGAAAIDEERTSLVRSEEVACDRCHYAARSSHSWLRDRSG